VIVGEAMDAALKTKRPRTKSRVLRAGLAGFAAIALLVLVLQPWWLAPLVAHQLSASAHRAVRIDAMWLSLSASFQPVVHLRGVRIDNAPWADPARPFAALASATAVFAWRSLDERRPVIALMVLRDGEVDLERRSDGLRNWRLAHPDDRGPGRVKVLAIRGERATMRVLDGPLALDFEARATPGTGGLGAADSDADRARPAGGERGASAPTCDADRARRSRHLARRSFRHRRHDGRDPHPARDRANLPPARQHRRGRSTSRS
jgi:hypothetical protein